MIEMKEKNNKKVKVRKVFLENLPKWENGKNKGNINWKKCIGLKVRFIYDDIEGWIEIVDYDGKYLYIKYQDKEPFNIKTDNFQNCSIGKLLGKKTSEFKVEIGQIFKDNAMNLIITDRKYKPRQHKDGQIENQKWYKYKCNKCGFECGEHYKDGEFKEEYWIEESGLLSGSGCACCCNPPQIVVHGINDITTTDSWMIPYFQGGFEEAKLYNKSSNKKIFAMCPDCGRVRKKETDISYIYGKKSIGCPYCGDGFKYPNKFMFNVLKQLGIDFLTEYSPSWIKPKRYDFYFELNSIEYIVEVHGRQHYERTGRKEARNIEQEQKNDKIKKGLALANNIEEENYIIIDCRKSELEFIKTRILNSKLNSLFDLSNTDWNKCEEFALSNRVKEACELKRDNPDFTVAEITKIMKSNKNTIMNYLKKGNKLGWCEYDPDEAKYKSYIKNGERSKKFIAKPIEILKDGVSLGVFESASELSRQSEDLFGVKLSRNNISLVLVGKRKRHKGFTFKYVQK